MQRPLDPNQLRDAFKAKVARFDRPISDESLRKMRGLAVSWLNQVCGSDDCRHWWLDAMFGRGSARDLTAAEVSAVLDWLGLDRDQDGYAASAKTEYAKVEAQRVITEYQKAHGQIEMVFASEP